MLASRKKGVYIQIQIDEGGKIVLHFGDALNIEPRQIDFRQILPVSFIRMNLGDHLD